MKFGVILADPPWSFGDSLRMSDVKRGASANYATLSNEEVVGLPVERIAAEDSVLVLWCPDSLMEQGLLAMKSYGYRQTQVWTWVKTGKHEDRLDSEDVPEDLQMAFGMGRLARACSEHMLIGVRGSPYKHLQNRSMRNIFLAPNLGHSKKPQVIHEAIEAMFPTFWMAELFARGMGRPGWKSCGLECHDTEGEDIRVSIERLAAIDAPPLSAGPWPWPDAPQVAPETQTHNPFDL